MCDIIGDKALVIKDRKKGVSVPGDQVNRLLDEVIWTDTTLW